MQANVGVTAANVVVPSRSRRFLKPDKISKGDWSGSWQLTGIGGACGGSNAGVGSIAVPLVERSHAVGLGSKLGFPLA